MFKNPFRRKRLAVEGIPGDQTISSSESVSGVLIDPALLTQKVLGSGNGKAKKEAQDAEKNAQLLDGNITRFTPDIIVAHSVCHGGQDISEVAWLNSRAALDDDDVQLICAKQNDRVFFIAAHAKDFAGIIVAGTELGHALPGMRGHRGDGIYTLSFGNQLSCVVKDGDDLATFTASIDLVGKYALKNGLSIIPCDGLDLVPWQPYRLHASLQASKMVRYIVYAGIAMAVITSALWIALAIGNSEVQKNVADLNTAVSQNLRVTAQAYQDNLNQPIDGLFGEMSILKESVIQKQTIIDYYKFEKGKSSWQIRLPKWVSASDYASLGANLKAELVKDEIVIRKD